MPGVDRLVRTVRFVSLLLATAGEVLRPGLHLGMLPDELPALTFGHPAPDPELNPVVECVGQALGNDGTMPTYQSRSFLRRTSDEELVWIGGPTQRFRNPGNATFLRRHG
jgi:hypothetical protein